MFDWSAGKTDYRLAIMPDDTSAIDFVLDEGVVRKIYASWDEDVYGKLMDYGGGIRAITAAMLREAGIDFLLGIKNIGQKRAAEIIEVIDAAIGEVPWQ